MSLLHSFADRLDPPNPQRPPTLDPAEWESPVRFAVARSRGTWATAAHLELIEHHALHAIQHAGRITVSASYRHGKSELLSRWLAAWYVARYRKRVVVATATKQLARDHSRFARDLIAEHGPDFGVQLSKDTAAAEAWELAGNAHSGMRALGVGGSLIGHGADLIIVDDPFGSFEDAMSPHERDRVAQWFTGTLLSRLEPGGAIIVICARWHEEDLTGRLLAKAGDEWTDIRIPAIADSLTDPLGRAIGEPLWPARYPLAELERMHVATSMELGEAIWLAQAQQTPRTPQGGMFPEGAWGWLDTLTHDALNTTRWCRAWDLAATKDGGDWTCGVLIGTLADGRTVVADVRRGQWSDLEVETQILLAAEQDPTGTHIELPQDPGQAGKAQAAQLTRKLAGYDVRALPVTGSKEVRATGYAAQQQGGQVLLVRARWNGPFVFEHAAFPKGSHDDAVDAGATGFNWLAGHNGVARVAGQTDRRLKKRR